MPYYKNKKMEIVVGSLNMDLVVKFTKIPNPSETLLGIFHTFPGGKGANQAVAASCLGGHVTLVGCVVDDSLGQELRKNLSHERVDTKFVFIQPNVSNGVALIQVDDQAQNSIAVASGTNFYVSSDYVEKTLQAIEKIDIMAMPLETPTETIYAAARVANQIGAKVILNHAPAQALKHDLIEMVDYLIPNEQEIPTMTGIHIESNPDAFRSAQQLISKGVKNLIITLGDKGSVLFDGKTIENGNIPAWKVQAVDTTAAGDCFASALAVGLGEGKSVINESIFASEDASISVTHVGAQPSLPNYEEVIQFMKEEIFLL